MPIKDFLGYPKHKPNVDEFAPPLLVEMMGGPRGDNEIDRFAPGGRAQVEAFLKRQPESVRETLNHLLRAYRVLDGLRDPYDDYIEERIMYRDNAVAGAEGKRQDEKLDHLTRPGSHTVPMAIVVTLRPGRGGVAEIDEIIGCRGVPKFPGAGLSISYVRGAANDSRETKKAAEARAFEAAGRSLTDPEPLRLGTLVCPSL